MPTRTRPAPTLKRGREPVDDRQTDNGKNVLETLLDLKRGADDEAIRAAYLRLSQRFHPHRYARYEPVEYRETATELYVMVQRAFARLSGSERLPHHEAVDAKRNAKRSARDELDEQISDAVALLERSQYDDAIAVLEQVLQGDPERAQARLWLATAQARRAFAAKDDARAEQHYRALLALQPGHAEARERLSQIAARAQRPGLLRRLFGRGG